MPIVLTQGAQIPNRYVPNQAQVTSAKEVIARLDYADVFSGPGKLVDNDVMRVDMQGLIAGPPIQHNIQVQVDHIRGHSTVAHANVSETLMTSDPANRLGVLRKVRRALRQSLFTARSYTVTGSIP